MSTLSLSEIVQSLGAKRAGSSWMARCPAHDDRGPSLAIAEGRNGGVVIHCHAGCRQDSVLDALRARGLWNGSGESGSTWGNGAKKESAGPVIAEYFYRGEHGEVLYRITRHEPKEFRAWRPNGFGGWLPGMQGVRRVPYNLPEVLANEIVFVVEGEKDCDSLRDRGFVATTNAFGSKQKWDAAFNPFFANKTIVCVPDMDEPGLKHMADVARGLLTHAACVYWHEVEGAKDISDWFAAGHSEAELCELMEALLGKS